MFIRTTVHTVSGVHTFDPACKWAEITVTGAGGGCQNASDASRGNTGCAGGTAIENINVKNLTRATATIVVGIGGGQLVAGGDSSYSDGVNTIIGQGGLGGYAHQQGAAGGRAISNGINLTGGTGSLSDNDANNGHSNPAGRGYWGETSYNSGQLTPGSGGMRVPGQASVNGGPGIVVIREFSK